MMLVRLAILIAGRSGESSYKKAWLRDRTLSLHLPSVAALRRLLAVLLVCNTLCRELMLLGEYRMRLGFPEEGLRFAVPGTLVGLAPRSDISGDDRQCEVLLGRAEA